MSKIFILAPREAEKSPPEKTAIYEHGAQVYMMINFGNLMFISSKKINWEKSKAV